MSRRSYLTGGPSALVFTGLVLLAGCGSSVPSAETPTIAPFTRVAGTDPACRAVLADLPTTIGSRTRTTSVGSTFAAVYGHPGIEVRCGVPKPPGFTSQSLCLTVNGIDWYLDGEEPATNPDPQGRTVVTTIYRTPALQVSVPTSAGPQSPSTTMAALTSVIKRHTKATQTCR